MSYNRVFSFVCPSVQRSDSVVPNRILELCTQQFLEKRDELINGSRSRFAILPCTVSKPVPWFAANDENIEELSRVPRGHFSINLARFQKPKKESSIS